MPYGVVLFLQNDENKHIAQVETEGVMDVLWREMQQTLHDYNKATEDKFIETESLRINDEQSLKEINTHKKHILKLQVRAFQHSSLIKYTDLLYNACDQCVCAGLGHGSAFTAEHKSKRRNI